MATTRHLTKTIISALIAVFIAVGCAGEAPDVPDPNPPTNPPVNPPTNPPTNPPLQPPKLTIVGPPNVTVAAGQSVQLRVQYTNNNLPQAGQAITFRFGGNSDQLSLGSYTVPTDAQGIAATTLTAGPQAKTGGPYVIEAMINGVAPVRWQAMVEAKQQPPSKTLAGTLVVESSFQLTGNFSGSSFASLLNAIKDMGDDPQDPGKYIVDQLTKKVKSDNAILYGAIWVIKQALYDSVNQALGTNPGSMRQKILDLSQQITMMVRNFRTRSRIQSPAPQPANAAMTVDHTLDAIIWIHGSWAKTYDLKQLGIIPPKAQGVEVTPLNGSGVAIEQHSLDLPMGQLLKLGLNGMLLPSVQPGATDIHSFLAANINCQMVGNSIAQMAGLGSGSTWAQYCDLALAAAGKVVDDKLNDLDSAGAKLDISGQGTLVDSNNDGQYDSIQNGLWSGSFTINKATAVISGTHSQFSSVRQ